MLTYNFENIGSDTLYEYLYKCIKNDIIQGKIKSGEKLPSKRALAKNLAISVITVENAYGQLAAEGYIYSVPKSGFYVADLRDDRMKSESGLSENRIYSNKLNLTGGKNAYIAAGSTITKEVDEDAMAIARARQENKQGYSKILKEIREKEYERRNKNKK